MLIVVGMARPRGHLLSPSAWNDVLALRGDTLTAVAERAGIPRATVSGLVGGNSRASAPLAHQLAAAAGVHAETLFPTLRGAAFSEAVA